MAIASSPTSPESRKIASHQETVPSNQAEITTQTRRKVTAAESPTPARKEMAVGISAKGFTDDPPSPVCPPSLWRGGPPGVCPPGGREQAPSPPLSRSACPPPVWR